MKTLFYLCALIVLFDLPFKLFAQYSNTPPFDDPQITSCIDKYWHYRDRLKYFIVPGPNPGESMVTGIRNDMHSKELSFGQQAVYQGYYLGVLATEYKLLSDNNSNGINNGKINQTLKELYYALYAYIWQMDANEQQCYGKGSSAFDGFFVRSRIPLDFINASFDNNPVHKQSLNNFGELTPENSSWISDVGFGDPNNPSNLLPYGKPGYVDTFTQEQEGCAPMSQDEAIGLLMGLTLVVKYIPAGNLQITGVESGANGIGLPPNGDFNLRLTAQEIMYRIVRYIGSGGYYHEGQIARGWCSSHFQQPWTNWRIYDPDCNYIGDNHGGNVLAFAHGFASAAQQWSYSVNYNDGWVGLWEGYTDAAAFTNDAMIDWMGCTFAAIGNLWPYNVLYGISHKYNWDSFYVLLWADLYNQSVQEALPTAFNLMVNAPCEGPYCYSNSIFDQNGWNSTYRWHIDIGEQQSGQQSRPGNYNGLDYMLLLNLSLIQISNNNCNLTGNVPFIDPSSSEIVGDYNNNYNVYCDNTIISNQVFQNSNNSINSQSAIGTYTSSTAIILKPGFKVENGARFHAVVSGNNPYLDFPDGITCTYLNTAKLLTTENNENNTTINKNDSIYLKYFDKYQFTVFPNPTTGIFTVNCSKNDLEFTAEVSDILNKIIFSSKSLNGSVQFDLSSKPKGIYFVKTTNSEGKTFIGKIVYQ